MSKRRISVWLTLIAVALAAMLMVLIYLNFRAEKIGIGIGKANGKIVGMAIGSLDGVTEGIQKGAEDGEAAGLSAEDTEVEIIQSMQGIGRLEVLIGNTSIKVDHSKGNAYEKLETINGTVVCSVNLEYADITVDKEGNTVYVILPEPEMELYLDQSSSKVLAEKRGFSITDSDKDGLTAYLNSMEKTVEEARANIPNYDALMESAKNAAVEQVEMLVRAVRTKDQTVQVGFK